jgi:hypothetical protein
MSTFIEEMTGGIAWGSSGDILPTINQSCPCNRFREEMTGGISWGGTATELLDVSFGGIAWGGAALVRCPRDPFDGTVAVYLLDQSPYSDVVGQVKDSSRHLLHGTSKNAPQEGTGPYCRTSTDFDGTNYVKLPQDSLRTNQEATITSWVKPNEKYLARTIYSREVFTLGYNSINRIRASVTTPSGTIYADGTTKLDKDIWNHIAAVWDPGNSLKVYVNGSLERTIETTETETIESTSTYIARHITASNPTATIQDVRIYPEAKSQVWIEAEFLNLCDASFIRILTETTT